MEGEGSVSLCRGHGAAVFEGQVELVLAPLKAQEKRWACALGRSALCGEGWRLSSCVKGISR